MSGSVTAQQPLRTSGRLGLSPDDVLRITGCSRIDLRPLPGDRRRAVRLRLGKAVALLPTCRLAQRPLRACLRDLSAAGIGLLYSGWMDPGEKFALRLPRPGHADVWVRCRAVRCEQLTGELYLVGARFEGVMAEAELQCQR